MRFTVSLAVACLIALAGARHAEASASNIPANTKRLYVITLNGKALDIMNVSGGDLVRTPGKAASYSPLEFDIDADDLLEAAPEFAGIIGGTAFYSEFTLYQTSRDSGVQQATRIITHSLTIEFPLLETRRTEGLAADSIRSSTPLRFHITLMPERLENLTPSDVPQTSVSYRGTFIEGDYSLTAVGLKQPGIDTMTSAARITVTDATGGEPGRRTTVTAAPMAFGAGAGSDGILGWSRRQMAGAGYTPGDRESYVPLELKMAPADPSSTASMTLRFEAAWPVRVSGAAGAGSVTLAAERPSLTYVLPTRKAASQPSAGSSSTPASTTPTASPGEAAPGGATPATTPATPAKRAASRTVLPPSSTAVVGQGYYADDARTLSLTVTDLRYSAERYAYGASQSTAGEILAAKAYKLLVVGFTLTNVSGEAQTVDYQRFTGRVRDAKGGTISDIGLYRGDDRSEDAFTLEPGETAHLEVVQRVAGGAQASAFTIADRSGTASTFPLAGVTITPIPAAFSPDGVTYPEKVSGQTGQWYPAGVLDMRIDGFERTKKLVNGEAPSEGYDYFIATVRVRNMTRREQAMPYQTTIYVFDAGGQSFYSTGVLDDGLNTVQPGFAAAGEEGAEQTLRFSLHLPKDFKITRIELNEGDGHVFAFKP